jgi:predicted nucleic acid-binding protein
MICVDASVGAKWILEEPRSWNALSLLSSTLRDNQVIVVPPLFVGEAVNILRQRMIRGIFSLVEAEQRLTELLGIPFQVRSFPEMHHTALRLAKAHDLKATYDAQYLALAHSLGCDFWTDDQKLIRAVGGHLHWVRWIGDYAGDASSPG